MSNPNQIYTNPSKTPIIITIISLILVLALVIGYVVQLSSSKIDSNNTTPKLVTNSNKLNSSTPICAGGTGSSKLKDYDSTLKNKLTIEDTQVGSGKIVKSGDVVCIHYKGTLTDGTEFDSSYKRNQPFVTQIGVGSVIAGWDIGIVGLQEGGKRKLTIPAELGYGAKATGSIPANSTLIFEVELVKVLS
jgi:FKBP-type peptidyl-prolyl cis-trans isomerase